jgi:hypothetical protein
MKPITLILVGIITILFIALFLCWLESVITIIPDPTIWENITEIRNGWYV